MTNQSQDALATRDELGGLSMEEIEKLRVTSKSPSSSSSACSLAVSGEGLSACSFNAHASPHISSWILDSSATDHMTPFPTFFTTYKPLWAMEGLLLQMALIFQLLVKATSISIPISQLLSISQLIKATSISSCSQAIHQPFVHKSTY